MWSAHAAGEPRRGPALIATFCLHTAGQQPARRPRAQPRPLRCKPEPQPRGPRVQNTDRPKNASRQRPAPRPHCQHSASPQREKNRHHDLPIPDLQIPSGRSGPRGRPVLAGVVRVRMVAHAACARRGGGRSAPLTPPHPCPSPSPRYWHSTSRRRLALGCNIPQGGGVRIRMGRWQCGHT